MNTHLQARLFSSFGGADQPPKEAVFFDDEKHYCKDWEYPVWNDLSVDQATAYECMTGTGRLYYLPGILSLAVSSEFENCCDVIETVLRDLTEPDFAASEYRYDTWTQITNLTPGKLQAIAMCWPVVESIVREELGVEPCSIHLMRRASFWLPHLQKEFGLITD